MKKQDYYNSVTHQVEDLVNLATVQSAICFDLENLATVLPKEVAAKIKRVIITGCGDSYSASGAMMTGFKKLSGLRK